MIPFFIINSFNNGSIVVRFEGDLDFLSRGNFEKTVLQFREQCSNLEIDLSEVEYIDSSGLAGLREVIQKFSLEDKPVTLSGVGEQLNPTFRLFNMEKYLTDLNTKNKLISDYRNKNGDEKCNLLLKKS